jgi:aldehyde:ferredoxin oxidoreductase
VNLTTGDLNDETLSEQMARQFIGGTGLGARVLYERMKPGCDPLGPDNILGFVTGPLTATGVFGGGRYTVVTKSPVTGGWADSNSGGTWGPELKHAGYDAVFVTGSARRPVYLVITEGKVELRDAGHLWGKETGEAEELLQKELGGLGWKIACIGPAGEKRSLMAGIVNEKGRIAARAGVGAVMGALKLKAIAVRGAGKRRIEIADPEQLKAVQKTYAQDLKENPFTQGLTAAGTAGGTSFLLSIGDCPAKNWNTTGTDSFPTCVKLDGAQMDRFKLEPYGCHSCPVRCGAMIEIKEGMWPTIEKMHRPEYETIAAFGPLCLNDNAEAIVKANELCNRFGLDTIAVGGCVAFAMECYENGLIRSDDTDGIELSWGNASAVVALTEKIARGEGFGEVLFNGVKAAAERIGKGAAEFAMHVAGHRIPYHDPRVSPATGTFYVADAEPACHMGPQAIGLLQMGQPLGQHPALQPDAPDAPGNESAFARGAAYYQLLSSAGLCALYMIAYAPPVVELLRPVTGWNIDWDEGLRTGKRMLTLRQAFNVREGVSPEAFELPKRFSRPMEIGPTAGQHIPFREMRTAYFRSMGWDAESGRPDRMTLKDLQLDEL